MPIIFFNIGWMCRYQGETRGDKIKSNFSYVQKHGTGHEQFNFLPINGYLYGYAPTKWDGATGEPFAVRLERIGGEKGCEFLGGVTVVMFSLKPQNKWAYIIGWYRDATVYRYPQELPGRLINGDQFFYNFRTRAENGVLVPESQRTFRVPSGKKVEGGYGQSTVWYADKLPDFPGEVHDYISRFAPASRSAKVGEGIVDLDSKALVEKNAIEAVKRYYRDMDFELRSVEQDNVGWDLEGRLPDGTEYFIEVKGLAGSEVSAQLTPNEYRALKKNHAKYVLAICTKCLKTPKIHIFSIFKGDSGYYGRDDDGNILDFVESVAASAKIRKQDLSGI